MEPLKFFRIREDAKIPVKHHKQDAGIDLFYCPHPDGGDNVASNGVFVIPPGASCLLATGLRVEVPRHHMLEIKNKSGIATKRQLLVGACVVDAGYNGELLVNLHNIGADPQLIKPGEKVAQAVLIPIVRIDPVEELDENEMNRGSTRGDGGFGSTGV